MLDIALEKEKTLSTQEVYEILDFAVQAAEDNGFINSFVFVRAMYMYAAIRLYEDRREELQQMINSDLLGSWDELVKDGTIENMNKDFYVDMNLLADYGQVWMDEFTAYAHSARGLLNTIQEFSADIVEQATQRLSSVVSNDDVKKVTDIAQEWGLNNDVPQA